MRRGGGNLRPDGGGPGGPCPGLVSAWTGTEIVWQQSSARAFAKTVSLSANSGFGNISANTSPKRRLLAGAGTPRRLMTGPQTSDAPCELSPFWLSKFARESVWTAGTSPPHLGNCPEIGPGSYPASPGRG